MCKLLNIFMRGRKRQEYWAGINRMNQQWREYLTDRSKKPEEPPTEVVFKTRTNRMLCCPNCWTVQPSNRDICCGYRCNTRFIFAEEEDR